MMSFPKLIIIYVASLILSSFIFSYFEDKTLFEGFYWSSVTATTIGYGDLLPIHPATKVWTVIASTFWVFFCIPCVVALILGGIMKDEHKFTHAEQEWQEEVLRAIATKLNLDIPDAPDDT